MREQRGAIWCVPPARELCHGDLLPLTSRPPGGALRARAMNRLAGFSSTATAMVFSGKLVLSAYS